MGMDNDYQPSWSKRIPLESRPSPVAQLDTTSEECILEELGYLLGREPGYLRIGYSAAKGIWARWKWTDGPLAGRYTFGSHTTLSGAIQALLANVDSVLSGKLKATLDKPAGRY